MKKISLYQAKELVFCFTHSAWSVWSPSSRTSSNEDNFRSRILLGVNHRDQVHSSALDSPLPLPTSELSALDSLERASHHVSYGAGTAKDLESLFHTESFTSNKYLVTGAEINHRSFS